MLMSSRMDKYKENSTFIGSRMQKNETLYQEITHDDLDEVNLASNAHVLGDNDNNIDIEKLKALLEKTYPSEPKRSRTFTMNVENEEEKRKETEETKEYDINAIIEKAKLDKDVDYEKERLKKIRDTQYDILKGLDIHDDEDDEEDKPSKITSKKDEVMNLFHTITENELSREMDPLDILTDLKGSDNTVVLEGLKEMVDKIDTSSKNVEMHETPNEKKEDKEDKTFFTNSMSFTKSDFDDFNDLKEDMESNKIIIRILLVIVIIAVTVGLFFLANHFLHLNWF